MRLTSDEVEELKKTKPIKLWRFTEPKSADVGCKYSSGGESYTVLDVRQLKRNHVMKLGLWDALKDQWPAGRLEVWCVTVIKGDRTDRPRLLAPTGRKDGDYTDMPAFAMKDEPEAVTEEENQVFSDKADGAIVAKQANRAKKQAARRAVRRAKKALDGL